MPQGGKLKDEQIAALAEWVKMGAPWPESALTPGSSPNAGNGGKTNAAAWRSFWSFQPVKSVQPPAVKRAGWVRNPIDAFILKKLEANGLGPNPYAPRPTLIRRA